MATYEQGDDNTDEVALIQGALGLNADGQFNVAMVTAVKAWQQQNVAAGDAEGTVGPDMLLALGLHQLVILENGDNGALVQALQAKIGVTDDEDFGHKTEAAVKAFQKKNGVKATGHVDFALLQWLGLTGAAPATQAPTDAVTPAAAPPPRLAPRNVVAATAAITANGRQPIASWAYQLAEIDPSVIAALAVDLAVIDYSAEGGDDTAFTTAEVAAMKQRGDAAPKKVVAYMSIGEAENYRYYWQTAWENSATRPTWLDAENRDWEGNFKVRFWDPAWQSVIMGSPSAYLDRIIAAGFDGVYLDIIDAFEYWRDEKRERPNADHDMITFVKQIAAYARARRPGFMIIPQNGEALLSDASYRAILSAQAKEDIFYGGNGDGKLNKKSDVAECLDHLAQANSDDLPILAVEYLDDTSKIADAQIKLAAAGCCAYFGPRDLALIKL